MIPTAGNLSEALQCIGVSADEIKTILLTHLHADHCRGLIDANGEAAYPNATVVVSAAEVAHWFEADGADTLYKVDTEGIVSKVKQEFAAKAKAKKEAKPVPKAKKAA